MNTDHRSVLLLTALLLITESLFAAYLKIDAAPENYELTRGGKVLEVLDGMYLMPGDHLTFRTDQAHASIVSANGALNPIQVPAGGKTLSAAELGAESLSTKGSQTWAWASDWLLQRVGLRADAGVYTRSVQAATRGVGNYESIQVPMAGGGDLRLRARISKPLHLAWSGGTPPYQVEIKDEAQKTLVHQGGIPGVRHTFISVNLKPGSYQIEIADDLDRVQVPLMVIADEGSLEKLAKASNEERLAAAMKMAARQEGWPFEAYQEAAAIKDRFPFAQVFMDALESGDIPH